MTSPIPEIAAAVKALSPMINPQTDWKEEQGFTPYNLLPGAALLFPVVTPLRNSIPRVKGVFLKSEEKGGRQCITHVVLKRCEGAEKVHYIPIHKHAPITTMTLLSDGTGTGSDEEESGADARSLAIANLLRLFMHKEEHDLLFATTEAHPSAPFLQAPREAGWDGIFAQLSQYPDQVHRATLTRKDSISDRVKRMAKSMAKANGILPDTLYVHPYEAITLTNELLGPNGAFFCLEHTKSPGEPGNFRVTRLYLSWEEGDDPGIWEWDQPISIRVHPYAQKGQLLLATSTLHTAIADTFSKENIPGPWSIGYIYDYLLMEYGARSAEVAVPQEIRTCSAFRIHIPSYFGWITITEEWPYEPERH